MSIDPGVLMQAQAAVLNVLPHARFEFDRDRGEQFIVLAGTPWLIFFPDSITPFLQERDLYAKERIKDEADRLDQEIFGKMRAVRYGRR